MRRAQPDATVRSAPLGSLWSVVLLIVLLVAACGQGATGADDATEAGGDGVEAEAADTQAAGTEAEDEGDPLSIAFLAASSQNAFNAAVYEGIQAEAEELENVQTQIFDGEFDAATQFNQVQDVVAGGQFDGLVILPNDTVGIAPALESAIEAGVPVITTLFPVGPDLTTLEPQVEGLTSTVAAPPAEGASLMAEEVADYCADLDPCRVVILVGQLQFPFDNVRYEAWQEVLADHDNIEVVATGEGNYNRDEALTAMTDILQSQQDIDVVLSGADQHLFGAEIALQDAGYDVEDVYMMGLGAAEEAVTKIREGTWDATKADFPRTMGELALEQMVNELRGQPVEQVVNMDEVAPVPPILTQEVLEQYPDFEGEFQG